MKVETETLLAPARRYRWLTRAAAPPFRTNPPDV